MGKKRLVNKCMSILVKRYNWAYGNRGGGREGEVWNEADMVLGERTNDSARVRDAEPRGHHNTQ